MPMEFCRTTFERAVIEVAEDVEKQPPVICWEQLDENQLWYELVACLLGSQVSFELALASVRSLETSGLLHQPLKCGVTTNYLDLITLSLSKPVWVRTYQGAYKHIRYRFPKSKATGIAKTAERIYQSPSQSIKNLLEESSDSRSARKSIVERSCGIGAKQASLFLRNVGYGGSLAILDSHVLRYMYLVDIAEKLFKSVSSIRTYELLELKLYKYADDLGFRLLCLDRAIWVVMRVYQKEFAN